MFYDWCEERLEIQSLADDILAKFVPPHVNLFYCFGGLMVTAFLFQGGSGFALTSSYQPRVLEAFSSVQFILDTIHLGWFLRSLHRWSSGVIVLILILHILIFQGFLGINPLFLLLSLCHKEVLGETSFYDTE